MKNRTRNNMKKTKHYIPILKWKRAEQRALQALDDQDRDAITPLIELVMPTVSLYKKEKNNNIKKTTKEISSEVVQKFKEKRVVEIPKEILQSWGSRPVFLDFSLLYEGEFTSRLKVNSLNRIIPAGMQMGLKIIPVINLNDEHKIKESACSLSVKYGQGICLRISASDLSNTNILNEKINSFLREFQLSVKNIDLLIDIKEVKEKDGQYLDFISASQKIDHLLQWRKFIFASGSFPANLTGCKQEEPKRLPRFDWQNWMRHISTNKLKRNPIFADYAIRNPIFVEALQYYNSSKSIKYSFEDDWLIMKGGIDDYGHYLANAKLLVEDTDYFYGEAYSWGDLNIYQKAKHFHEYIKNPSIKGTGRTEDWIAYGINHHIKLVVDQIASLF